MLRYAWSRLSRRSVPNPNPPRQTATPIVARVASTPQISPSHRSRVLAMQLSHSRLCGPRRADRLSRLGITTLGDLLYGDLRSIAANFGAPQKAAEQLGRYRRAIRLAAAVPNLSPADALVLVTIHRRNPQSLIRESAGTLHRDLIRFSNSTLGRSTLRGRPVPSLRRIKRWIAGANATVAV